MEPLREAAQAVLDGRGEVGPVRGSVERVSMDVEVNGQREMVSVSLRDGRLASTCSCGAAACTHRQLAIAFIAGREIEGTAERLRRLTPNGRRLRSRAVFPDRNNSIREAGWLQIKPKGGDSRTAALSG